MRQTRRLSAQGICLSLGLLLLVLSFSLSANQAVRKASGGVNLRMSGALGAAGAHKDAVTTKSRKASTATSASTGGARGSGAQGVTLELSSDLIFDDNVFRTTFNEQRDVIVKTKPKFYLDGRMGKHRFRLGYEGEIGRYQGFRGENYSDHKILGAINFDIDRRLKANLKSSLQYGHDARGDLSSRSVVSSQPDKWHRHDLSGDIVLGRRIAKAQIGLGFGLNGIRYMTNEQGVRDFDEKNLRLFGRYNLSSRYALLGEVRGSWTDYLDFASDQASREFFYLGGVAWEGTAKTSGEFKLGMRHRDFNTIGIPSTSGLVWDSKLLWSPRSYSKVTLYTSRETNSSARQGSGGTTTTDTIGLKWRHSLTRNFRFVVGLERVQAGISDDQTDRLFDMQAGIRYRINRWVDLKADWKYSSLSSSDGQSDYEANTVFFGLDAKLSRRLKKK